MPPESLPGATPKPFRTQQTVCIWSPGGLSGRTYFIWQTLALMSNAGPDISNRVGAAGATNSWGRAEGSGGSSGGPGGGAARSGDTATGPGGEAGASGDSAAGFRAGPAADTTVTSLLDVDSAPPQPVTPSIRATATVRATFVRQRMRSKVLRPSAERWVMVAGSAARARNDTDRRVSPLLRRARPAALFPQLPG